MGMWRRVIASIVYKVMLSLPDGGPMIYAKNALREPPHRCVVYSPGKMDLLRYKVCHYSKFGPSCAFISLKHLQSENSFTLNDSPINLFMGDFSCGVSTGTWRFNEHGYAKSSITAGK